MEREGHLTLTASVKVHYMLHAKYIIHHTLCEPNKPMNEWWYMGSLVSFIESTFLPPNKMSYWPTDHNGILCLKARNTVFCKEYNAYSISQDSVASQTKTNQKQKWKEVAFKATAPALNMFLVCYRMWSKWVEYIGQQDRPAALLILQGTASEGEGLAEGPSWTPKAKPPNMDFLSRIHYTTL